MCILIMLGNYKLIYIESSLTNYILKFILIKPKSKNFQPQTELSPEMIKFLNFYF